MKFISGWWVPDHVGPPSAYIKRATELVDTVAARLKPGRRAVAVQAGGHVGPVPVGLSKLFARVYTWEPELRNFQCLVANTYGVDGIYPARGFLGDARGCLTLAVHQKGSGGHGTLPDTPGPVPVYRIDDLGLDACDAICLDTEGFDLFALMGAKDTLSRHRPLVIAEENKAMLRYGRKPGDMAWFLERRGYAQVGSCGEDLIFEAKP